MRHKVISVFLGLMIVAAPSIAAAQWPAAVSGPAVQAPSTNPLFPAQLGIPWFGIPQFSPYPQSSGMPNATQAPPIAGTNRQQFPLPISPSPALQIEIVYVGNLPVQIPPLPLPPNPIVARLQSFGFLLQLPMIKSPVENPGNR